MTQPLRLLAEDADDLEVISAALRDAATRMGDIHWEPRGRRLTIAFNRFRWEASEAPGARAPAGLQLGGVLGIKTRNLRRDAGEAALDLLAITFDPGEPPGGVVNFAFADGADLAAMVECIDAVLVDLPPA